MQCNVPARAHSNGLAGESQNLHMIVETSTHILYGNALRRDLLRCEAAEQPSGRHAMLGFRSFVNVFSETRPFMVSPAGDGLKILFMRMLLLLIVNSILAEY